MITTASSPIARDRQRNDARQSVQFANAGDPGEFGEQRPQRGDGEAGDGQPGPERPERRADQFAVATAGEDAETDGEFLHDVEDRYQQELQAKEPVAPLHAGLAGGDDGPDIAVGQHDHEAGAEHGEKARTCAA